MSDLEHTSNDQPLPLNRVLALDTSTEVLSVALGPAGDNAPFWQHEGPGGAQASAQLIPLILSGLAELGWRLAELDAVVFGQGPGSFTGLRTACSVVQGLAWGARAQGLPVLPVNTLLATAEDARWQLQQRGLPTPDAMAALLDARMNEIYAAAVPVGPDGRLSLSAMGPSVLMAPEALLGWLQALPPVQHRCLVGNATAVYAERLGEVLEHHPVCAARPTATALLRLAPGLWRLGHAVPAEQAQPLYVRDKVAQTTAERERMKAEKAVAAAAHGGAA
ncbi:MAG: tRNA ((37)-N6)-threonylcarbamoyltransferase complex dimerization subunit type 1 TsaB [Pseudomonadota bacterium]|jgi:tRNA threonylcarbamoyladenosine biosynthesis protein TsaB